MKFTTWLKLKKPELTDVADIDVLNGNFDKIDEEVNNKVDKIEGKGLSTEDYTSLEKEKLSKIADGAQVNTVTGVKGDSESSYRTGNINITKANVGLGSVPNVSTNNQTPTFSEATTRANIVSGETLSTLFGKVKKYISDLKTVAFTGSYTDLLNKPTTATTSANGLMSSSDKSKLDGIASGANNYTHPSYTAKTGVPTANQAPAFGGTFSISQPVSDSMGHITALNSKTITIPGAVATTSANGLMSYTDKAMIDNASSFLNGVSEYSTGACQFEYDMYFLKNVYVKGVNIGTTLARKKRAATLVIGTSAAGYTANDVDYLCDGTADQEQINAAITALPSGGGKIVLLEGTYNISDSITVNKANVTIEGMGSSTILNGQNGIWLIKITGKHCEIDMLKITFDSYSTSSIGIYSTQPYCAFKKLDLSNAAYGINCGGGYSFIHDVYSHDNLINIHLGSGFNTVSECIASAAKETGIRVEGLCNIVTSSRVIDSETYGIYIINGGKSSISNNIVYKGNGDSSDYSTSQYTIYISNSTQNSCNDNIILGKNYVNNGGATNVFDNNKYA